MTLKPRPQTHVHNPHELFEHTKTALRIVARMLTRMELNPPLQRYQSDFTEIRNWIERFVFEIATIQEECERPD